MEVQAHLTGGDRSLLRHPVRVRCADAERFLAVLRRFGFSVVRVDVHELRVEGSSAEEVGSLARFFGVGLRDLSEPADR